MFSTLTLLSQIYALDPVEFENFVARIFISRGYQVRTTARTGDEGVDIYLIKGNISAIVQCKRFQFKSSVGQPIIRDLYGTMMHNQADKAYLVTTGKFSKQARSFAAGKPIELVDGNQIQIWLSQRAMRIQASPGVNQSPPLASNIDTEKYTNQTQKHNATQINALPQIPLPPSIRSRQLPAQGRYSVEAKPSVQVGHIANVRTASRRTSQKQNVSSSLPTTRSKRKRGKLVNLFMISFSVITVMFCILLLIPATQIGSTANNISLPTTDITQKGIAQSQNPRPTATNILTPDVESTLKSQLISLDGVNSITDISCIKAEDGTYTVFVNADVKSDYINGTLANEMKDNIRATLGDNLLQLIIFLDDSDKSVNYIWSKASPTRWTVTTRNK